MIFDNGDRDKVTTSRTDNNEKENESTEDSKYL